MLEGTGHDGWSAAISLASPARAPNSKHRNDTIGSKVSAANFNKSFRPPPGWAGSRQLRTIQARAAQLEKPRGFRVFQLRNFHMLENSRHLYWTPVNRSLVSPGDLAA